MSANALDCFLRFCGCVEACPIHDFARRAKLFFLRAHNVWRRVRGIARARPYARIKHLRGRFEPVTMKRRAMERGDFLQRIAVCASNKNGVADNWPSSLETAARLFAHAGVDALRDLRRIGFSGQGLRWRRAKHRFSNAITRQNACAGNRRQVWREG